MLAMYLLALVDPLTIQIDRALFAAFVTIALFFLTHVVIAIKWGSKVSADVHDLLVRVSELSKELHGIRDAVVRFNVTEAQFNRMKEDIHDLELRMREVERE